MKYEHNTIALGQGPAIRSDVSHGDHLPVCFHGLLNERLGKVAELSESRVQGHG